MKKFSTAVLLCSLLLMSLSGCKEESPKVDSSHLIVHYTDTGDAAASTGSKLAEIDNKSSDIKDNEHFLQSSDSSSKVSSEKQSDSSNKNTPQSGSSSAYTVSTVTYYYTHDVPIDSDSDAGNSSSDNDIPAVHEPSSDTDEQNTSSKESSDADTDSQGTTSEEPAVVEEGSYTVDDIALIVDNQKIVPGESFGSIEDALGEPKSIDDISVDDENKVLMYNYEDFWLIAVKSKASTEFVVESVQIFGDSLETEKGIKVGMPSDTISKTYGGCTVVDGQLRYYAGNIYMYFDVQNGIIADIGYCVDSNVDLSADSNE